MTGLLRSFDRYQRAVRTAVSLRLPNGPNVVQAEAFRGARIIILGPAETVFDDLVGTRVDDFDIVVRLNNGISLAATRPEVLGTRTDILVHNMREDGARGAGAIPAAFLHDAGVRTLICPNWGSSSLRRRYRDKRDRLASFPAPRIEILPRNFMTRLRADLSGRAPTVGISAILYFLTCEVETLAIYGFTFFETRYADGYNDAVRTPEEARAWVDTAGAHEPLSEKAVLKARLPRARAKTVILGRNVTHHLDRGA